MARLDLIILMQLAARAIRRDIRGADAFCVREFHVITFFSLTFFLLVTLERCDRDVRHALQR